MLEGLKTIAEEIQEQSRKNTKGLILFFVSLIILGVVGFCEILYVAMLLPAFPDGLVRGVAIAGACATGASAIALLVGKLHWFSSGKQSYAAWGFVGVETFILAINVLLAVQLHNGHVADWLVWWEQMYPAAPLVAFVGWGAILFLDKDNEMRSYRRENKERQEKKELDYENLVHHATLTIKHESLQILTAKLRDKIASSQYQAGLDVVTDQIANSVLGQISGQHITSLLPPPAHDVVDADTSQPAQSSTPVQSPASQPVPLDNALVQQAIDYVKLAQAMQALQQASPLQQARLTPEANQAGTNGNGH